MGRFALARPAPAPRAHRQISAHGPPNGVRGPRGKRCAVMKAKAARLAAKAEAGEAKKEAAHYETQVQIRSQVDHGPALVRCAEPNCQTHINPGGRGFYYPGDKSLYGSRCGHGEKAERDFAVHRIDEDTY
jgi:hypothetical protein